MTQSLPTQQLPQCDVCKMDPVPQSTQHLLLFITEILLLFYNYKFSIILLMLGYSFPKTVWKCPFCSREIKNVKNDSECSNNIILRMGNCMALFSLNKFRIIAFVVIGIFTYLYVTEPKFKTTVKISNDWEGLITNVGYEAYIENSYRATHIYQESYSETGFDWELKAIYLDRSRTGISTFENIFVKMDPSQFEQASAYDFKVFTKLANGLDLKWGDEIYLKGEWEGRQYHNMIFIPIELKKTGKFRDPAKTEYFYKKKSMLRDHFDAVKDLYAAQEGQQIIQGKGTQGQTISVQPEAVEKSLENQVHG